MCLGKKEKQKGLNRDSCCSASRSLHLALRGDRRGPRTPALLGSGGAAFDAAPNAERNGVPSVEARDAQQIKSFATKST
jgi:hypothetical protein